MRLSHRTHTRATPAEVWELLGTPSRWPQFDVFFARVRGASGQVAAGQHLLAVGRGAGVRIPVDVLEVVPERRLVIRVHAAPGLREEVRYELTPALRGGCDISASVVVDGLFARPAVLPLWVSRGASVRVLAARTDRTARALRRRRGAA